VSVVVVVTARENPPGPVTVTPAGAPSGSPLIVTSSDPYCAGNWPGSEGPSPEQEARAKAAAANAAREKLRCMEKSLLIDIKDCLVVVVRTGETPYVATLC
jgi:hypothetical protein